MIIPVGKNKHQVSQGGLKHESLMDLMDSDLFKVAQGTSGLLDRNKQEEPVTEPSDELQQAVDDPSGSLGMNPPGADAGQQPQPVPQLAPQPQQQPQQGGFEQAANQIAMKVLEGLNLQPAAWDVNTAVQNQAGQVSAITIKMTRGANMKAVAKATNSGQTK